ncbi:MAG: hypothetical protein KAH17_03595 [Bacteroidales bacterium]|nr:hypothetical protein [Bacteroidales bacterium]
MRWIRKISNWLVGLGILLYLVFALSFTESKMDGHIVSGISVEIKNMDVVDFVGEEEVIQTLKDYRIRITNEPIDSINKAYVKERVIDIPQVRNAEVFFTPDGLFHIKVWQRIPAMRIISNALSFYVDQEGEVLPMSSRFSARVPVFTGNINIRMIHEGLFELASYLNSNPFWSAQVEQVQVWDARNIELVPRMGSHKIFIGGTENLEWKFRKLRAIYETALPVVGWNCYESIDLRYSDQVVCKRKSEL